MDQAAQLRALVKEHNDMSENAKTNKNLAKVITVTSGKGGVGKTSISINLAMQLANLGKKVIIIDADVGLANVEVMLGIRPSYDLGDLMYGNKKLSDIITMGPMGIQFISGGSGINELNNLSREQIQIMTSRLYELDELAEYIIIDTGAGISDIVMQFIKASSQVLIIATPEPTSITDAYALIKALNNEWKSMEDSTCIKLISNRVGNENEGRILYDKLNGVVQKFLDVKLDYLGTVVHDSNLQKSILCQQPASALYPNSVSVRSIRKLAEILANERDGYNTRGISGLFTQFFIGGLMNRKGEVGNGV